jgi:hypothetical protein
VNIYKKSLILIALLVSSVQAQIFSIDNLPIKINDTIAQVQTAMGTNFEPKPYESTINPNGTRLPFDERGIYVFFDQTGKVAIIRLEKKFAGKFADAGLGDNSVSLINKLGAPTQKNTSSTGVESLYYKYDENSRLQFDLDLAKNVKTIFIRRNLSNNNNSLSPLTNRRVATTKTADNDEALRVGINAVLGMGFPENNPYAFRTYQASGYYSSAANIASLKQLLQNNNTFRKIEFLKDPENRNKLWCRASFPVYGPNKTAFSPLLEAAFNLDLINSGAISNKPEILNARLDEIDFSSVGQGKWTIQITFLPTGKAPLTIREDFGFTLSLSAENACSDVNNAMPKAIEYFLYKIYQNPSYLEINK